MEDKSLSDEVLALVVEAEGGADVYNRGGVAGELFGLLSRFSSG